MTIAEQVRQVIAEELVILDEIAKILVESVTNDLNLVDLGIDSLSQFEIAMVLEERFDIQIEDDDWVPVINGTVGDVVALVERLIETPAVNPS